MKPTTRRLYSLTAGLVVSVCFQAAPALADSILALTIQPIQVCQNDGTGCANPSRELFLSAVEKIWAQADITMDFLPWTTLDNGADLSFSTDAALDTFMDDTANNGASAVPNVATMWFINTLPADPGFVTFGEVRAIPSNRVAIADATFSFPCSASFTGRMDTIGHELGHLLGLTHTDFGAGGANNLMTAGSARSIPCDLGDINPDGAQLDQLTVQQVSVARSDSKLTPVPEPASLLLLCTGLLGAAGRLRRPSVKSWPPFAVKE